jgi:hypothetical protein
VFNLAFSSSGDSLKTVRPVYSCSLILMKVSHIYEPLNHLDDDVLLMIFKEIFSGSDDSLPSSVGTNTGWRPKLTGKI